MSKKSMKRDMREEKKRRKNQGAPRVDDRFYMLRNAAYADRVAARQLIEQDPSIITTTNGMGETALHFLVVENDLEAVEFLARHGSDVNNCNRYGQSAILEATQLGYVEMVGLLLRLGATVDVEVEDIEAALEELEPEKRHKLQTLFETHGFLKRP